MVEIIVQPPTKSSTSHHHITIIRITITFNAITDIDCNHYYRHMTMITINTNHMISTTTTYVSAKYSFKLHIPRVLFSNDKRNTPMSILMIS